MFLLFSFYYARHQITSIRNSGNPALVFQHLSFQSYHVIHQQEHNTVDWRTVEKTQKIEEQNDIFYSLSLFPRLQYKPA